jgi:hypothetical protein
VKSSFALPLNHLLYSFITGTGTNQHPIEAIVIVAHLTFHITHEVCFDISNLVVSCQSFFNFFISQSLAALVASII